MGFANKVDLTVILFAYGNLIPPAKQFEKYDRTAKDVIDLLIQEGNEFYLTHRYDKRGRTYSQGYQIQGVRHDKSCG